MQSFLRKFSPARFPYPHFGLALAIAAAGGFLFVRLKLPLPWMLGAMTFCTAAALLRAPIRAPRHRPGTSLSDSTFPIMLTNPLEAAYCL